ncbi:NACHT domain-containing protein [Streptomyces stramineus]
MTTVRLLADALGLAPEHREALLAAAVHRTGHGDEKDETTGHVGQVTERPGSALQEILAGVGEQLAQAVAARWQREEEHRQVHDPYPLPVRWLPAPEELTDHWANIRALPAGVRHGPLDLSGRLDDIAGVYRRIPSGRLVVLGRPGSGKTVLAVRFVLDHLASRARADAVPVIFSIGSWDPTALTFRDWLTRQLTRDHPGLAAPGPAGPSLAAALVDSGRVLPVLDGFDEIADGLRRPALEALNATTLPLLLTSRPAEYAAAVAETDVLTSAAAVNLSDLTLSDLADYLPRTTRKAGGGDPARTAWDPVLSELRERPHSRAGADLATVLTTPLMVALARAVYSDTPGHDPVSLLDTRRFAGPGELEEHLLDNFVATVYRPRPEYRPGGSARREVDPERARYWLGYLAHHLTRLDTPNLEWWRLGSGLRRSTRTLVTALMVCLATGLVDCAVGTLFDSLGFQLADGLTVGVVAGLMFGIAYWFMVAAGNTAVAPSGVRMKVSGRTGGTARRAVPRLLLGLLCGLVFGFGYGFVRGVHNGVIHHTGLPAALYHGLCDGTVYGLAFSLAAPQPRPAEPPRNTTRHPVRHQPGQSSAHQLPDGRHAAPRVGAHVRGAGRARGRRGGPAPAGPAGSDGLGDHGLGQARPHQRARRCARLRPQPDRLGPVGSPLPDLAAADRPAALVRRRLPRRRLRAGRAPPGGRGLPVPARSLARPPRPHLPAAGRRPAAGAARVIGRHGSGPLRALPQGPHCHGGGRLGSRGPRHPRSSRGSRSGSARARHRPHRRPQDRRPQDRSLPCGPAIEIIES